MLCHAIDSLLRFLLRKSSHAKSKKADYLLFSVARSRSFFLSWELTIFIVKNEDDEDEFQWK